MPKTIFIDGNEQTKFGGTRVLASFLNLIFKHRHDGLDQDGSAPSNYALDTGQANACAIALTPPLTQHIEGMPLWFKVANASTGPATLAVNGLAPVSIRNSAGNQLGAGDLRAGQMVGVVYTGAVYQLVSYQVFQTVPPGQIASFAMSAVPSGWLACDGSTVSRIAYPDLFAAIGETYGPGDGATTFKLPDCRGEFLRGVDGGRGVDVDRAIGTAQSGQIASHYHGIGDSGSGDVDFHLIVGEWTNGQVYNGRGVDGVAGIEQVDGTAATDLRTSTETGVTTENRPRNISVNYCIKF